MPTNKLSKQCAKDLLGYMALDKVSYQIQDSYLNTNGNRVYWVTFYTYLAGNISDISLVMASYLGERLTKTFGVSTQSHPRELINRLASNLGIDSPHIQEIEILGINAVK